ncbi:GNAT family N-acetyltransferase [Kamptonema sp. UHCC 0994]|uniref:GNAT family N-acetyltransferase n=1 Tax=Kamptonema sp. UHCC 0994 TaxID=3031329 RepID=UPI0023B97167|nr:GNAT family N-acetyltransferase [Kamptonema sp. UHCC 0994]MDF0554780.1 GNAT family N-acetyltransferase [Kamptonema sp. UHCC 0994]
MTINYRVAKIADLTILLELVKEFHEKEKLAFDEQLDRDALASFLGDASLGQLWLIQQKDEVIGYIILSLGYSLEYRGRDAFLDEFYVRPKYRGQGIGTQTLTFAEETCRLLGIKALHLEVDFENPDAQRLYHRVGYQRHHRFLMTKDL